MYQLKVEVLEIKQLKRTKTINDQIENALWGRRNFHLVSSFSYYWIKKIKRKNLEFLTRFYIFMTCILLRPDKSNQFFILPIEKIISFSKRTLIIVFILFLVFMLPYQIFKLSTTTKNENEIFRLLENLKTNYIFMML